MTSPIRSRHWLQNVDLTIDGHYPDGDKAAVPTTPDFEFATTGYTVLTDLVTNTAFSEEVRDAHVTGGDAGFVTLGLDQVSGDNYATKGWSQSGDFVVHPSNSVTGSGVWRHSGEYLGTTKYSPNRAWQIAPPPQFQIKWNPGHSLYLAPAVHVPTYNLTTVQTQINEIVQDCHEFIGIHVSAFWGELEPTKNNYTFQNSSHWLRQIFTMCKNAGLRFSFSLHNYRNGSVASEIVPPYVASEPNSLGGYFYLSSSNYMRLRLDASGTMTRYLALVAALGDVFDGDAKFEAIHLIYDSIVAVGATPANFTGYPEWAVQYNRIAPAGQAAFPSTNIATGLDWGFLQTQFPAILVNLKDNRCGVAGPDSYGDNADHLSNGKRAFIGGLYNGSSWVYGTGGIDYRGQIPNMPHTESAELGQFTGSPSLATQYSWWLTMKQQHTRMLRKNFQHPGPGTDVYFDNTQSYAVAPRYTPDIKTFFSTAGAHPLWTTKPTTYAAIVTGG